MESSSRSPRAVRFGVFEFDLRSGELRKQGRKIRLEGQPVRMLIKLLDHNSINTRNRTLAVLGPLKDERAVAPVVRCFTVFETRYHGDLALKAMGPIAEKEVLALLSQNDDKLGVPAIRVLAEIGTQQSIPVLQKAAGQFNLKGVSEAAIVAINKRTKKQAAVE